ncbi:MAG: hypothetical protein JW936_09855 [Sedimentisphaerales bacterium]|nr:hypothetical protein [Sedimentisphaerales bacterium]
MFKRYGWQAGAMVLMALVMLSLLLFGVRKIVQSVYLEDSLPVLSENSLVPPEVTLPVSVYSADPNEVEQVEIEFRVGDALLYGTLGILDGVMDARDEEAFVYRFGNSLQETAIYYDEGLGLVVRRIWRFEDDQWVEDEVLYARPGGISTTADEALGRFSIGRVSNYIGTWSALLYDDEARRFYYVDFGEGAVREGPELAEGVEPVSIDEIERLGRGVDMVAGSGRDDIVMHRGVTLWRYNSTVERVGVLDSEGGYRRLDVSTLTLSEPYCSLLNGGREDLFHNRDLLAYQVFPICKIVGVPADQAGEAGAASRDADYEDLGYGLVTVDRQFDVNGYVYDVNGQEAMRVSYNSERLVVQPFGGLYWVGRYLLESLQGPGFLAAGFYGERYIDAVAGERALFVLPNSVIGLVGYETRRVRGWGDRVERFFILLILLLPSLLLSGFLAWRVGKDAKLVGLTKRQRRVWVVVTVLVGLSGYIGYRLTRVRKGLVTCGNCGDMRRVDQEFCHCCGGSWAAAELQGPVWRMCGVRIEENR